MNSVAVYVGCAAGKSIDIFDLDPATGTLSPRDPFEAGDEVQWLAADPDGQMLYAAVRSDPPTAVSLRAKPVDGGPGHSALDRAGEGTLPASMAYITTDRTGAHLLAASYNDDLVSVSRLDGGIATGEETARVVPGRHAHTVLPSPDNRHIYATALGADLTAWWSFDATAGKLDDDGGTVASEPGSGPRHLRFSNSGHRAYVLHEMAGTVTVFNRDDGDGALTPQQTITSIPEHLQLVPGRVRDGSDPMPGADAIWCAELRLTPDNRFLYTTERSSSTITVFAVDKDSGLLSYVDTFDTETQPRGMNITADGQYLLACGEVSNSLSVYRIGPDGGLSLLDSYPCSAGPRCIEFNRESAQQSAPSAGSTTPS